MLYGVWGMTPGTKIESFVDLNAWRESHKYVLGIYKYTQNFPVSEQFGLTNQVRRAGVSITSNIAEGFSRATKADKMHFYTIAKGSLTETQNQLILARDIGYLRPEAFHKLADISVVSSKLLTGLMKSLNQGKGLKP